VDLVAWRDAQIPRPEILYWRTATNQEVDLVIESGSGLVAIEVKTTSRPTARDARHLQTFRDEYRDRFVGGLLLHDGEETLWMSEGVLAAPWWKVI
jgi:predicted AAA+ superfamily ATPase